jgi:hypothetical protein
MRQSARAAASSTNLVDTDSTDEFTAMADDLGT